MATCLDGIAGLSVRIGRPEDGAKLLGAAAALRESMQAPVHPVDAGERAEHLWAESSVKAALDDAAFQSAWSAGRAMSPSEAAAFASDVGASPDIDSAGRKA